MDAPVWAGTGRRGIEVVYYHILIYASDVPPSPPRRPSATFPGSVPPRRLPRARLPDDPRAVRADRHPLLRILHELRAGERTVGDLVAATGLGQANLSRHLQYLLGVGFVSRRKAGLHVWYALADRDVLKLCDVMCGRLDRELAARRSALRR
jgi:DNA-binding transcriptional ArsR family regulator